MLSERKGLLEENEFLTERINTLNKGNDQLDGDLSKLSAGLNQSLNEIAKLEYDHKAEMERAEVKLRLLEETLNKRNEK